jgi:hypothetical protein
MVSPDTLGAEDAFAQISFKKRIDFFDERRLRDFLEFYQADAAFRSNSTQFTPVTLVTHQARVRMTGQHEFDYNLASLQYPCGLGVDYHS